MRFNTRSLSNFNTNDSILVDGIVPVGSVTFKDVKIVSYGSGFATSHGYLQNESFVKESTILPMYEMADLVNRWEVEAKITIDSKKYEAETLDKAVILTSSFDGNYQHFLVETLPKLYFLNQNYHVDIPVVISNSSFIVDIVTVAFPDIKFTFVDNEHFVKIEKSALFITPFSRNLDGFHPYMIDALRFFSDLIIKECNSVSSSEKKLFISRRRNKSNTGHGRVMLNQDCVVETLSDFDYSEIAFEGLTFKEKAEALKNTTAVVTPIGANIMNLVFARNLMDVIIISHATAFPGAGWFRTLIEIFNPKANIITIFEDVTISAENEKDGNVPYEVNIESLKRVLDERAIK